MQNIPSGTRRELCVAFHAEATALQNAHDKGLNVTGATAYVTASPCIDCAKLLNEAGISRIVYGEQYPDKLSMELIEGAKVKLEKFEDLKIEISDSDRLTAKKILEKEEERQFFDCDKDEYGNKIKFGFITLINPKFMSKEIKTSIEKIAFSSTIKLIFIPTTNLSQMAQTYEAVNEAAIKAGYPQDFYIAGVNGIERDIDSRITLERLREELLKLEIPNAYLADTQILKKGNECKSQIYSKASIMLFQNTSITQDKSDDFEVSSLDSPDTKAQQLAHKQSLIKTLKPLIKYRNK